MSVRILVDLFSRWCCWVGTKTCLSLFSHMYSIEVSKWVNLNSICVASLKKVTFFVGLLGGRCIIRWKTEIDWLEVKYCRPFRRLSALFHRLHCGHLRYQIKFAIFGRMNQMTQDKNIFSRKHQIQRSYPDKNLALFCHSHMHLTLEHWPCFDNKCVFIGGLVRLILNLTTGSVQRFKCVPILICPKNMTLVEN